MVNQMIQKIVWMKNQESFQLLLLELGWPRKFFKHLTTTMEYEDPHESNTMYKYSHMMVLYSSLRIHDESYTRG
jgi:hypothetical protein